MREETATSPAMQRYLPRVALEWELDAPDRPWQAIDATLVFVDISGFTRLSEKLARRGRIGAEVLTEVLSAVFGRMLALAYERGGALLKFGGDALLLMFRSDDHAVQACSAAVEMRAALRAASGLPSAAGRLDLKMSVGIHSGTVHLFLVGDLHRELLVAGPAATLTAAMEKAANQGQIMVSPATADALPRGSTGPRVGPGHLLRWRRARVAPIGAVLPRQVPPDSAVHFLPARLRDSLAGAGRARAPDRLGRVHALRRHRRRAGPRWPGRPRRRPRRGHADRPTGDRPRGRHVPRQRPRQQRLQGPPDHRACPTPRTTTRAGSCGPCGRCSTPGRGSSPGRGPTAATCSPARSARSTAAPTR